jgi:uncharacterized protein YggT (Ycf19 family)
MKKFTFSNIIVGLINFVFSIIEISLLLRFLFKLFGARDVGFAEFLYDSTDILLDPFRGIFRPEIVGDGSIIEFSTLIAMVVYGLATFLLLELIAFINYNTTQRKEKSVSDK